MILTPIPTEQLGGALDRFAARLEDAVTRAAFESIRATSAYRAEGEEAERHRREALAIADRHGVAVHPQGTDCAFNWDGVALNGDTEAYVILHEIAHFVLSPSGRRRLLDFGLGPGPDTVARDAAERATVVAFAQREAEEAEASLLGILWEAALGHPALASFLDQNWLEGLERSAPSHFTAVVHRLWHRGLVDLMNIEPPQSLRPSHRIDPHHRALDRSNQ
jgi:regulator of protease activity HflC (stomatin/prohibitin superfamily)